MDVLVATDVARNGYLGIRTVFLFPSGTDRFSSIQSMPHRSVVCHCFVAAAASRQDESQDEQQINAHV